MELKKEIVVFGVFAAFLGWGTYGLVSGGDVAVRSTRGGAGGAEDYARGVVPDVALALPREGRDDEFGRDLFTPPRDTAPLPPLTLTLPPIETLDALTSPSAYGPTAAYSGILREQVEVTRVPDLFGVVEGVDDGGGDERGSDEPGGDGGLSGFGDGDGDGDLTKNVQELADRDLTQEERIERIAARKRLYDWIIVNTELKFGHIRNKDRFDLGTSPDPIEFSEVDPITGAEKYAQSIEYTRDRVDSFGLADTPWNRVELERRKFGTTLRPGDFEAAMRFAVEALELRNDTDRALPIAEEMFQLAGTVNPGDILPRLWLARCYELGFRFEEAFAIYRELTTGPFHTDPEGWARLGDLYARFRLRARAEEAYGEALRRNRTNWLARWRYGRFLLDSGDPEEALDHLQQASQREPSNASLRTVRVGIRSDLGAVLLALGRAQESKATFERASSADPDDDTGLAGAYSAALFLDDAEPIDLAASIVADGPDASFDLLLALGLTATRQGEWAQAESFLDQAAAADPFRAWLPLRSLSWLAEITGHPEEAFTFISQAYEQNPVDPWTLYQRGRLLAAQDDPFGAMGSFRAALDRELDFPDALIAMGLLSQKNGRHTAAERFYARALGIDPERPIVHSLRGFNFFSLSDPDSAEASFRSALQLEPDLASAQNGLAWWYYVTGNSEEARIRFANLVDSRRNEADDDPHKLYATEQEARIAVHEAKEVWTDRFDRVRMGNGWTYDQGHGIDVRLREGQVFLEGTFAKQSRTRLYQELATDRFLSFEATVTVLGGTGQVDIGIFAARETDGRQGDTRVHAAVELERNEDGVVQARVTKKGEFDAEPIDLFTTAWPIGKPMRVRLDKAGEKATDTAVTLWVDDVPVMENIPIQTLGRSNQPVRFGVYVQGDSGRTVNVSVDDVNVVRNIL